MLNTLYVIRYAQCAIRAMNNFLKEICEYKQKVIADKKEYYFSIKSRLDKTEYTRYSLFKKKISQQGKLSLIAEIKKASPSKGLIREDFDVLAIAQQYSSAKADAISVLTEDKYFLGKPEYIKKVTERFDLPVLAKDFIVSEGQIYEARINGASAVLLIVAILNDDQIRHFMMVAASLDLDCLVEVHTSDEVKRALGCGAEIIGINNRDLETFQVNLDTASRLVPLIPKKKVIVVESGIQTKNDIDVLKGLGVNAVLIGETFMRAKDIGQKVKEIME